MVRRFQLILLFFIFGLLAGCNDGEKNSAVGNVKIGDLSPPSSSQGAEISRLKTMNFEVYTVEVPAEHYDLFNDLWGILYKPFHYRNYAAFRANYFQAGLGRETHWIEFGRIFQESKSKKLLSSTMMFFDGRPDNFEIRPIYGTQSIYYSVGESMNTTKIGPGVLGLQLVPQKIPGAKGICTLTSVPKFASPIASSIPQLQKRLQEKEVTFTDSAFSVKLSPGEFIILGPEKYIDNQTTLGGMLFSRPLPEPCVRLYVIVCTSIVD
ncbi:MAG: hypothetical protein ACYTBP_04075 [Planctomycetota bacterium]|jgi:hypothetical protein